MVKPITPAEAGELAADRFPDFVIAAFNQLITSNLRNGRARFTQPEAILEIVRFGRQAGQRIDNDSVLRNNWLDVEPAFRKAGWKVVFDKPGYCENYMPFWVFEMKPVYVGG